MIASGPIRCQDGGARASAGFQTVAMHLRDDSPRMAFLFLGLVLVAAVLLVAGYGAPVGVGAIVGLLLGAIAAVAFIAMAARRNGATAWSGFHQLGEQAVAHDDERARSRPDPATASSRCG